MTTPHERTEDAIKRIVSIVLGISIADLRTTDSLILDLGADSLDLYDIVIDVEKEFGIEISDEEMEKFRTVGDLVDFVL